MTFRLPIIPTCAPLSLICEFTMWSPTGPTFVIKFGVKNCSSPNAPVFSGPVITILLVLLVPAWTYNQTLFILSQKSEPDSPAEPESNTVNPPKRSTSVVFSVIVFDPTLS